MKNYFQINRHTSCVGKKNKLSNSHLDKFIIHNHYSIDLLKIFSKLFNPSIAVSDISAVEKVKEECDEQLIV